MKTPFACALLTVSFAAVVACTNDPSCGTSGNYFECKDLGVAGGGCQAVKVDQRPQLCK